jgi:TonB family protein
LSVHLRDPVDAVLVERADLERGFMQSVLISGFAHALLVGGALAAAWLGAREPLVRIASGFAVSLPPGGYGTPAAAPAPPAPAPPAPPVTQPAAAKPEPPPKIIKPPQEAPRRGLPDPEAKPTRRAPPPPPASSGSTGSAAGASGPAGFSLTAPPGAGVPGGTDPNGDWYLAGVQRKIWVLWAQQVKSGMSQPAIVSFTILASGEVTGVRLDQSSGVYLLDRAAQSAVLSAAPFGPLPRDYGTNRITIQGIFKPNE